MNVEQRSDVEITRLADAIHVGLLIERQVLSGFIEKSLRSSQC